MARLGVAPHVANKILNHQTRTISGVAAVYQRHEFLAEREDALDRWGGPYGWSAEGRRALGGITDYGQTAAQRCRVPMPL
jgi:hypothetical protein